MNIAESLRLPNVKGQHLHSHHLPTIDKEVEKVVAKDATLIQDRSGDRRSFQGRFRATAFGDKKHNPSRKPEIGEAHIDNKLCDGAKAVAAERAEAVTDAAAADGVVIEETTNG
jgi:hypothetical protein